MISGILFFSGNWTNTNQNFSILWRWANGMARHQLLKLFQNSLIPSVHFQFSCENLFFKGWTKFQGLVFQVKVYQHSFWFQQGLPHSWDLFLDPWNHGVRFPPKNSITSFAYHSVFTCSCHRYKRVHLSSRDWIVRCRMARSLILKRYNCPWIRQDLLRGLKKNFTSSYIDKCHPGP